jgi:integrase/recombinase XerD
MENFSQEEIRKLITGFKQELLVTGYSPKTIKMYLLYTQKFLEFSKKPVKELNKQDIVGFLAQAKEKDVSNATMALMHASLKYFLEKHLSYKIIDQIKIPKKAKKLPVVLTRKEAGVLFKNTKAGRNRLILQFLYGSGCRVSEAVNIKTKDLDFENCTGMVKGGKGNKDRIIILSQKWVRDVKKYVNKKKVKREYLFSKKNGKPLSTDTIERITREAARKAKMEKTVTPHVLRHSFATHLLESGENIRKIQVLLGHANLSTTSIYTHVSQGELKKVQSPLDRIK